MRDITIKNFRCYEEKSIEFRRGVNLLIGDNSVGKTSLLHACNLVMNAFFPAIAMKTRYGLVQMKMILEIPVLRSSLLKFYFIRGNGILIQSRHL